MVSAFLSDPKLVCIKDILRSHSLWLILCVYGLAVLEKIECETQQAANGRELGLKLLSLKREIFELGSQQS